MRGSSSNWYDIIDPRAVLELPVVDISNARALADRRAIKDVFISFGRVRNARDGREVAFPAASVGKMWFNSGVDIRMIAAEFANLFRVSVRAWSEPNEKIPVNDKRRRLEAVHQYVAKFGNRTGRYYIRFTVKENKGGKLPRAEVHASVVSNISIYKTEGAELSTPVKTQAEDSAPFVDDKIALFLSRVNGGVSNIVHIALVANDRYRPGLECTKASMIRACATPERLVFHEYGDKDMEPFLAQVESDLLDFYGSGSKLTYLRLFLPDLLPDCDWVLYADVDTLWFRDPCELWELRDESKSVCWVRDLEVAQIETGWWAEEKGIPNVRKDKYACAGIALINLKRWRETDFIERMRVFLKAHGCPLHHDQDIMNFLLENDSRMIGEEWNTMIPPRKWRPCVLHITGIGRRLNGSDHYDGNVPQYVFWFNYWRRYLLALPPMKLSWTFQGRFVFLVLFSWTLGPLLDLADKLPGGYAWKMAIMRLRRQLGWARFALGFCPASR